VFETAPGGPRLRGVRVEAAGAGAPAETNGHGRFEIAGLPPGLATLRLSKPGFAPLDTQADAREDAAEETYVLSPLETPRRLDDAEILTVQQAMATPALAGPYRVAILDAPRSDMTLSEIRSWRARLGDTARAGFYAPWLTVPGGRAAPPSGHVCGLIAEAEARDGPHRAGANLGLRHADGVTLAISDAEQALLNPDGINAIRAFPGRGVRVWGARSLSSDPEWRFLTTRRLIDVIEKTLERSLQWAVFEPNAPVTRQAVAFAIRALLDRLWRAGALAGTSPAAAFRVAADVENNPPARVDAGQFIADVAVAPAIPFEFIHFRLGRALDAIEVTE
jgi:phage tail sheath protein FI